MKVKNLDDLRAMQKSGAVKKIDGMKFVEPQAQPLAAPAPSMSLEPLVAAIKESMDKQAAMSQANTKAIYELLLRLAKNQSEMPAQRQLRWKFTVERDEDGFMESIRAESSGT